MSRLTKNEIAGSYDSSQKMMKFVPTICVPDTEGCKSGLIGTPGKCVYIKSVPRVRIPNLPLTYFHDD